MLFESGFILNNKYQLREGSRKKDKEWERRWKQERKKNNRKRRKNSKKEREKLELLKGIIILIH